MSGVRVSPWLLSAVATAAIAILPLNAAVAPKPSPGDETRASETVRERAEKLAEAASGRFSTLMEDEAHETDELVSIQSQGGVLSMVTDWLERAARDYQSHVIEKLSIADDTAGAKSGEAPGTPGGGFGEWVKDTVRAAFGWLQGWVSAGDSASERETAQASPKPPSAPAKPAETEQKKDAPQQIASNDRSEEDARDFVEARRKADEDLKEVQRLAQLREKTAEEKRRAEADLARRKEEAELKAREDARKADMARRHEENERRINDNLRKLDEAHKAAEEKRREAERVREEEAKKAADRRAALAAEAAEAKRVAEAESRKADEEKRVEDERARAAKKAAEERMLTLASPPPNRAPEVARAADAGTAAPPPVRADLMPELRLPSARTKTPDATVPAPPGDASNKGSPETKTAANEPPPAAQPKASESAAAQPKPKVERRKSARQQTAKRAKAQRRTHEARSPGRKATLVYVVKPGDTLSAIAKRYLGNRKRYDVIYRANRHKIKNPNVIQAYQRIVVPLRKA